MTRALIMLALGAVLAWSLINLQVWYDPGPRLLLSEPAGIMGTSCRLVAETTLSDSSTTSATLSRAEAELRRLEAIFSTWIDSSVVSRFNQAAAGGTVAVPPEVLTVLAAAREAYQASEGAFDITCRPQLELWKQAVKTGQLPSAADREQARAASNWSQLGIQDLGLSKQVASMCIDLGGLAKGYAIDQAAACLLADGCVGVLDVGGDVRCLGQRSDGRAWPVQIRDPFGDGLLQGLLVVDRAVCTSGNYARFSEIEGKHYSHIVDPRTAEPADAVPSATVIAPTAMQADIWATALSVLGEAGLALLPADCEALLVLGTAEVHRQVETPGFAAYRE